MRLLQHINSKFSQSINIPIVDVSNFLTKSGNYTKDCASVADSLHKYGVLIIKDPRVNVEANNNLIELMEKFFQKRAIQFYAKRPVPDIFPEHHFQVGACPQFIQQARADNIQIVNGFKQGSKALTPFPPPFDAKWRYLWNIGDVTDDIVPNQVPKDFPQFKNTMENWGQHMINGCFTVAEMAAIGLGLDRNTFSEKMKRGPHKLAPTGSDLIKHPVGSVFAGFHYDFNFLTIHGKSRYPGLFCWLRNGQKFKVSVPQGHLLLQAGKQFEYITGGHITCGFHEVIYTKQVQEKKNEAIKAGRIPWRISSTLFSTFRGQVPLKPLPKFLNKQSQLKYPQISTYNHAMRQLQTINLKRS